MVTNLNNPKPGVAGGSTEDYRHVEVLTGDIPRPTISETVADATVATAMLPIYSVVTLDTNNELVLAEFGDVPVGITTTPVAIGAVQEKIAIYKGGMFNPARLNFHPSFDTDDKKLRAFDGIDTILMKENLYQDAR